MKLTCVVFALFTLSVIVKGNVLAAVAKPVMLGIGTIFTVMNQDVGDIESI